MINFYGVINSLGYGVFTYNLMRAYDSLAGGEIAFFPNPFVEMSSEDSMIRRWLENGRKFNRRDPGILITQAQFLNQFSGTPMIGFPIFELDLFTEMELKVLQGLDMVLQPSAWGKKVVENHGIKEVHVVSGGYDPKLFSPVLNLEGKLKRMETQGVTFVHIGKFEVRKSSLEILSSFLKAIEGMTRKVNLVYHVCNPFDPNWLTSLEGYLSKNDFKYDGRHYIRDSVKILIPRDRFQSEPGKLYQMADFGIWASKAEGWNLPLLECLACGVPCLTTDNTAQADFIRNGIYPEELILKSHQREPTRLNGKWWPIDQGELAGKIRDMIDRPEAYLCLSEKCYQSVKEFTWENSAKKLDRVLKGI